MRWTRPQARRSFGLFAVHEAAIQNGRTPQTDARERPPSAGLSHVLLFSAFQLDQYLVIAMIALNFDRTVFHRAAGTARRFELLAELGQCV